MPVDRKWEAGGFRPRGTRDGGKHPYYKAELTVGVRKRDHSEGTGYAVQQTQV